MGDLIASSPSDFDERREELADLLAALSAELRIAAGDELEEITEEEIRQWIAGKHNQT